MTKVVFRKFKQDGDIIALFSEEIWSRQGYTIASYMHVGQHSGADYDHVVRITTPATESEYANLLNELKSVGYNDLRVMCKCRPNWK